MRQPKRAPQPRAAALSPHASTTCHYSYDCLKIERDHVLTVLYLYHQRPNTDNATKRNKEHSATTTKPEPNKHTPRTTSCLITQQQRTITSTIVYNKSMYDCNVTVMSPHHQQRNTANATNRNSLHQQRLKQQRPNKNRNEVPTHHRPLTTLASTDRATHTVQHALQVIYS